MIEELLKEKSEILESLKCYTLSYIYEEKQTEMQRLDEIYEEIQNIKRETHRV